MCDTLSSMFTKDKTASRLVRLAIVRLLYFPSVFVNPSRTESSEQWPREVLRHFEFQRFTPASFLRSLISVIILSKLFTISGINTFSPSKMIVDSLVFEGKDSLSH